tara:strand:- start:104 stop:973 length:870 start_codon:yes stop_codon:yes gene_type:complete
MILKQFGNAPKFTKLQQFAVIIQTGNIADIQSAFITLKADIDFSGKGWQSAFSKLENVFNTSNPEFSIFAMGGNSKLPFVSFSTLPGVTCPGAGDCIKFCYSFRAWRYPSAFARMAQNTFLMRFNQHSISKAFIAIGAIRGDNGFDFRLYVDGDFSNASDVNYWMSQIKALSQCRAYGYSKSFSALLEFTGEWPSNYQLNISGGHNSNSNIVDQIKLLPITRGEFIAVSIGRKVKAADHGTASVNEALRRVMGETKIFPCPGACGSCTGKGHACGMTELKGRVIAIAMH